MPKMDSTTLKAILQAQKADALSTSNSAELVAEREKSMEYYLGKMPDLPAQDGRSSAVSSDVADTIEGLMPQLMDIFAGSDEVVRFEPVGPEDEKAAQQETDYVNHVFMQINSGFMALYSFIKDALLSKVGIVKVWWEEREEEERETYFDQSEEQYSALVAACELSDGAMKIVAHTQNGEDEAAEPMEEAEAN
jgi:hypothetical protein